MDLEQITGYLPSAAKIAEVALGIFKVMPGTAGVVSAIELGIKIANGIVNEIPVAVKAWEDIQTAASGGKKVTDEEWAAWEADVTQAHDAFRAALARVEAQS